MFVCMFMWISLCGSKAGAKPTGLILFKFTQDKYLRPEQISEKLPVFGKFRINTHFGQNSLFLSIIVSVI